MLLIILLNNVEKQFCFMNILKHHLQFLTIYYQCSMSTIKDLKSLHFDTISIHVKILVVVIHLFLSRLFQTILVRVFKRRIW